MLRPRQRIVPAPPRRAPLTSSQLSDVFHRSLPYTGSLISSLEPVPLWGQETSCTGWAARNGSMTNWVGGGRGICTSSTSTSQSNAEIRS